MENSNSRYRVLYFLAAATSISYILWRIFFTIPFGYGALSVVFGIALTVAELVGMIEGLEHCIGMTRKGMPKRPQIEPQDYPDVDVFISTYNENQELLYKTVNGCKNMDYPDQKKVHIFLCDDGHREEIRKLAEQMQVGYITRESNEHAKAGNLNHALSLTKSPLVATFDADMIPLHDFLTATVPYFFLPDKIGFIQTPQSFYNTDLFQYNLYSENKVPNEQDYFFRDVNVGKNSTNSPIYAGSNTVIAREALEAAGGIFTGVITEDFATGIRIQEEGYVCYAVDEVHAIGLAPEDLKSLIKQRERWARGCIQTFRKVRIWTNTKLSFGQKMGYTSCLLYWYTYLRRFIYIFAPILFAVFGIPIVKCSLWELAIFWFPSYFLYNRTLKLLSGNIRTTRWSNIYDTIMMPSLVIPVLLETIGIRQTTFSVTSKKKEQDNKLYRYRKIVPHAILAVLSLIGLYNTISYTLREQSAGYLIIIFWLSVNLYNIVMAIFFLLSRNAYRTSVRFYVQIPIQIETEEKIYEAFTKDISDGGFSFIAEEPLYFQPEKSYGVKLRGHRVTAQADIKIAQVNKRGEAWDYGVKITGMDEENKSRYYQIIYDREPTLPKSISQNLSIFDDLYINIHKRMQEDHPSKRKLARVYLKTNIDTREAGKVWVEDFNFEYIAIKIDEAKKEAGELTLLLQNDITIRCRREKDKGNGIGLYRIENINDFVDAPEFKTAITQWSREYEAARQREEKQQKKRSGQDYRLDETEYL